MKTEYRDFLICDWHERRVNLHYEENTGTKIFAGTVGTASRARGFQQIWIKTASVLVKAAKLYKSNG